MIPSLHDRPDGVGIDLLGLPPDHPGRRTIVNESKPTRRCGDRRVSAAWSRVRNVFLVAGCLHGLRPTALHAAATVDSPLTLVATADGRSTSEIAVVDKTITPRFAGQPARAGAAVTWSLDGDVLANPDLVRFSPIYFVRRDPHTGSADTDTVTVTAYWYVDRDAWPSSRISMGGLIVCAWLVDSHPATVSVAYAQGLRGQVRHTNQVFETSSLSFTVPARLARGVPIMLLRENDRWIEYRYSFGREFEDAMLAIYRDDGAAFRDAITGINNLDARPNDAPASLLHLAAEAGRASAVDMLLERGARPEIASSRSKRSFRSIPDSHLNESPLDWAVRAGRASVVERLIQAQSLQDLPTSSFDRMFQSALEGGWTDIAWTLLEVRPDSRHRTLCLEELIEGTLTQGDAVVLERVLGTRGPDAFATVKPETVVRTATLADDTLVRLLLQGGANPDTSTAKGTALVAAASHRRIGSLRALLDARADVNLRAADGTTPLQTSVRAGHAEGARLLLSAGADPNRTGAGGTTPLHEAVASGQAEVIRLLLENQARVDLTDSQGLTPLDLALRQASSAAVDLLVRKNARLHVNGAHFPESLEACLQQDRLPLVQRAVEDGWDANTRLRGAWLAWQLAEFEGARATAAWLRASTTEANATAVLAPSEVDRQPQATVMDLGRDARLFPAPLLAEGVELTGVITPDGTLVFGKVVRSPNPVLTKFVLEAMPGWRFQPALKLNVPVAVHTSIAITFAPDKSAKRGPKASEVKFRDIAGH